MRSKDVWPIVHEERRALLDDLEALAHERWSTPSMCDGWDVHDVLAHLVDSAKTTRRSFVRRMVLRRFDFDADNADGVKRERRNTEAETLAEFRRVLHATSTPPASLSTRLVEVIVHGEDIRRPLGVYRAYPTTAVIEALRYQLKTGVSMGGGRQRARGLCIVATDADFTQGEGPEVHGKSTSLLLAVSARPVNDDELSGPGSSSLRLAR
jgi:uncharacterized protein (TIGR03083 family)